MIWSEIVIATNCPPGTKWASQRGRACAIFQAMAGGTIGSRNLPKSSRWPSRGLRSWTITCTCWCGWIRRWPGAGRMLEGFSLGNYLLLVEYTGRMLREGKAAISGELARVFERLGSNAENWQGRLQKLAAGRLLGRFFAASRARLREVAERLGVHHLANLGGCAAR